MTRQATGIRKFQKGREKGGNGKVGIAKGSRGSFDPRNSPEERESRGNEWEAAVGIWWEELGRDHARRRSRWQGREKERRSGRNSGEVVQGGGAGRGGEEGKTSASREFGGRDRKWRGRGNPRGSSGVGEVAKKWGDGE